MSCRYCFLALLLTVAGCGPSSYSTPAERGAAYLRGGDYDEAISALGEAIEANPRDVEAHLNRGKAYQYRGFADDLDRAIEDFTQVIALAPNDPDAYYNRSMAYRDRGREGDAELSTKDNDAAHDRDPRFTDIYKQMPVRPVTVPDSQPTVDEVAGDKPAAPETGAESADTPPSNLDELFERRRRLTVKEPEQPKRAEVQSPVQATDEKDEDEMRRLRQRRAQFKARQAADGGLGDDSALAEPRSRGSSTGFAGDSPVLPSGGRQPLHRRGEGSPTNRDRFSTGPTLPTIPTSPWQRNPYSAGAAAGTNQSPMSRGPRPTGFADEPQAPFGPFRPQARSPYDRPSALPNVRDPRPTGPDPDDFYGP